MNGYTFKGPVPDLKHLASVLRSITTSLPFLPGQATDLVKDFLLVIFDHSTLSQDINLLPAKTVCQIWLPLRLSETLVHGKWLPTESAHVILLLVETLSRKHNYHADSLGRKPFLAESSLDRKQEIADSLSERQI